MALSVVYTTINGRMIQQVKGGQVTKFVSDTLGSVVAEVDDTGQITHTADYWPYGEVRTETGTKKSPFGYVGVLGYMKDFADALYVRARYLRSKLGRWQTVDPNWPKEPAFKYCRNRPISRTDYFGLRCRDCPVTAVTGLTGFVKVDCSCRGLLIAIVQEQDEGMLINPVECGRWYDADGFHIIRYGDTEVTTMKVKNGQCVVIKCSGGVVLPECCMFSMIGYYLRDECCGVVPQDEFGPPPRTLPIGDVPKPVVDPHRDRHEDWMNNIYRDMYRRRNDPRLRFRP